MPSLPTCKWCNEKDADLDFDGFPICQGCLARAYAGALTRENEYLRRIKELEDELRLRSPVDKTRLSESRDPGSIPGEGTTPHPAATGPDTHYGGRNFYLLCVSCDVNIHAATCKTCTEGPPCPRRCECICHCPDPKVVCEASHQYGCLRCGSPTTIFANSTAVCRTCGTRYDKGELG